MRILLVEESSALRKIISAYLAQSGWAAEDSTSLAEARLQIANKRPTFVVVALEFGAEAVLRLLRELDDEGIDVLVISDSNRVQDRVDCLEQGAMDFMSKPLDLRELSLRLKRFWRARSKAGALPANMEMPCGGAVLDIASRVLRGKPGTRQILLTPSEFRLLYLLLRNEGRIVERALIARDVLGHSESNNSRSVDVMVSKLRRKLGAAGSGRFVRNVRSEGYVLVREERERIRSLPGANSDEQIDVACTDNA